jgi:hypothetical protein
MTGGERYFREALKLCPYHLPALIWYCNTFIDVKEIWNFDSFKKWYLQISRLGFKQKVSSVKSGPY